MKGRTDMNAVAGEVGTPKFSDAEISGLLEQGTEYLITVAKNMIQKQDLVALSSHI